MEIVVNVRKSGELIKSYNNSWVRIWWNMAEFSDESDELNNL